MKLDDLLVLSSTDGATVLVTDTVYSPGLFLLTHFAATALRRLPQDATSSSGHEVRSVHWVGFGVTGRDTVSLILRKNGCAPPPDRFTFLPFSPSAEADTFNDLVQTLKKTISKDASRKPLVVLDDLTSLLWAAEPAEEAPRAQGIVRAIMELQRAVISANGTLVILLHGDELSNPADSSTVLFRRLLQRSDIWLQVSSLSAQSKGELSVHRGPALNSDTLQFTPRAGDRALQFVYTDASADVFVKGSGRGFLS